MKRDGCTDAVQVGGAGDNRADVKATDPFGRRWVIQCKHRRNGLAGSPVGTPDLYALNGIARQLHGADFVALVTNGRFTSGCLPPARSEAPPGRPQFARGMGRTWAAPVLRDNNGGYTPGDRTREPEAWMAATYSDVPLATRFIDGLPTSSASMPSMVVRTLLQGGNGAGRFGVVWHPVSVHVGAEDVRQDEGAAGVGSARVRAFLEGQPDNGTADTHTRERRDCRQRRRLVGLRHGFLRDVRGNEKLSRGPLFMPAGPQNRAIEPPSTGSPGSELTDPTLRNGLDDHGRVSAS
ncbi:restriction endonuclease [Streptomyces sp. NBC_00467]|uniref:restriction endonuclease n=1 Tax=Streptomyces sp. NBC_00467 TaxID=2975752 RepID=UPI003FA69294